MKGVMKAMKGLRRSRSFDRSTPPVPSPAGNGQQAVVHDFFNNEVPSGERFRNAQRLAAMEAAQPGGVARQASLPVPAVASSSVTGAASQAERMRLRQGVDAQTRKVTLAKIVQRGIRMPSRTPPADVLEYACYLGFSVDDLGLLWIAEEALLAEDVDGNQDGEAGSLSFKDSLFGDRFLRPLEWAYQLKYMAYAQHRGGPPPDLDAWLDSIGVSLLNLTFRVALEDGAARVDALRCG